MLLKISYMANDFTTQSWILENVHRLSDSWSLITELPAQLSDSVIKSIFSEDRMFHSQSVSNLVQGKLLRYQKFIVLINSSSLEKVANFVAGVNKIFVTILKIKGKFCLCLVIIKIKLNADAYLRSFGIGGGENLAIFFRRLMAQSTPSLQHFRNLSWTIEVIEHHESIAFKLKSNEVKI